MGSCRVFMLVFGVLFSAISASSGLYSPLSYAQFEQPSPIDFLELQDTVNESIRKHPYGDEMNCQLSTVKGRRQYQEDRVLCNLSMPVHFHDNHGIKTVNADLVAVFDGHIGQEASEMVSKRFVTKFLSNTLRRLYPAEGGYGYFVPCSEPNPATLGSFVVMDEHKEILKDELLRTIKNVDDAFTHEAKKHNLYSGTTAVVALLVDNQILVANVGDSKALLCSKNARSSDEDGSPQLSPKELTRDHNAFIDEERARIKAAGGFIVESEVVPLVMGHFPMTRAIGDVPLKRYGIISVPEVTGWLPLSANDTWLVVASDGIFESLTPKDVCNILAGGDNNSRISSNIVVKPPSHQQQPLSAAEFITQTAYYKGSQDNLSVVVVPLSVMTEVS